MVPSKIAQHMTVCPFTIGAKQKLTLAHEMMREHGIRHLPVLLDGQLVGILSQRDLYFIETLRGAVPEDVTVEEAMTPEPFSVDPDASVERVVREMAERKFGAAVVMEDNHVVGLFTTTDAMKVLAGLLSDRRRGAGARRRAS